MKLTTLFATAATAAGASALPATDAPTPTSITMMTSVVSASVPLSSAASTTSIPDAWYDCTWTTGLKTATTSVDCDGMSPEEVFGWEGLGGDVCQAIKYVTVPVTTETACATSPSSCTTTIKKMGWPNGYWCKTTVAPTTVTESVDCQGCALKIERPWAAIKIMCPHGRAKRVTVDAMTTTVCAASGSATASA